MRVLISPKVLCDGSAFRNEFKRAARDLVRADCYHIFQRPEHIAHNVRALLNMQTGVWMHNGLDLAVSHVLLLWWWCLCCVVHRVT